MDTSQFSPIRVTDKSGNPLVYPVYADCIYQYSKELKSLQLRSHEACIYAISAFNTDGDLIGYVVGESCQKFPEARTYYYKDTVSKLKHNTARTIVRLQELMMQTSDKMIFLFADVIEVCKRDERRAREKFFIDECREMGLPVLNAT